MNTDYEKIDVNYILNATYEYDTCGVIYARYSSHSQTEQSIEGQLRDNFEYAKRERIKIVGVYIDRALSGKTDDRPQFQQMIKDSAKRQWQYVIVWKLDRFARNRYDSAIYKFKLKSNGVRVLSSQENISDSPEGVILESVLEGCAEYYSLDLQKKILRGNKESYMKGQACGGIAPYGYKIIDKKYVPDDATAPIIQYIFKEYANGKSKKDIFAELSAKGIKSRSGKPLNANSFSNCFSNRCYIGEVTHGGILYTNIFPPLIDVETFNKVQLQLERKKHAPAAQKAVDDYLLRGKAFCGHCGASMVGECGTSRNGERYYYYTCINRKRNQGCNKKLEKKKILEQHVVELALKYVLEPKHTEYIAERIVEVYNKEFNYDEIRSLERRIAAVEEKLNKNTITYLETVNSAIRRRIEIIVNDLEIQRQELETDLEKLKAAIKIRFTKEQIIAWLNLFTDGTSDDPTFCRRIIDCLFNSVYIYDDKFILYINVKDGQVISYIDACEDLEFIEKESKSADNAVRISQVLESAKIPNSRNNSVKSRINTQKNPKTDNYNGVRISKAMVGRGGFEPP